MRARGHSRPDSKPCNNWRYLRVMSALCLLLLGAASLTIAQSDARNAVVLHWDGAIGPATADYISRGLREAATNGAALVILRLDTPGGLDTSMRDIIRDILGSGIPVIAYVNPSGARAASAGTYMLYASHIAAMSPGTNLGAATPVQLGGGLPKPPGSEEDQDDGDSSRSKPSPEDKAEGGEGAGNTDQDTAEDHTATKDDNATAKPPARKPDSAMEAKVINDAVAYIRSLAELRGRNADWAEQAVRSGDSLSAKAALEQNVIDLIARDINHLLDQIDGRTVTTAAGDIVLDTKDLGLQHLEPDWRTRLLGTITNPNVALILMLIGVYGLIFEFMNPGALYPGTIGAICLLLGLYALAALPVNYAGAGLMLLGLVLMVGEAFAPSFGVLGIGGTIAFVLGATILIDTEAPGYELSWPVIAGVAAASLILTLVIVRLAYRSMRRPIDTGVVGMIGAAGEVIDWAGTQGHVYAHGERWQARGPGTLEPGNKVEVVGLDGLTLEVTGATESRHTKGDDHVVR